MQLKVRHLAALFDVPANAIYRWIDQKGLPGLRIREHYHFNRVDLLDWAMTQHMPPHHDLFLFPDKGYPYTVSLRDSLARGAIVPLEKEPEERPILQVLIDDLPLPTDQAQNLLSCTIAAGATVRARSVGKGVAIPHVRHPVLTALSEPEIRLYILPQPWTLLSLEGDPIQAWFWILSPTVHAHLQVLERLCFALEDPDFLEAVMLPQSWEEIVTIAQTCEARFNLPVAEEGKGT